MGAVVSIQNLIKTYQKGEIKAVNDVSFEVAQDEIFGLIGPDGAGKTSIFRMLTTLILPDSGSATVTGFDIVKDFKAIRNTIGYMPQRFSLYQDLSVEENISFFATIFNVKLADNYHLIEDIYKQLEPFKDRRAGKLSGGMKQKLALCCALIHKPTVLFLDEPTTGVDAVSRKEFWEMLKKLKEQGITIVVSTPYMDEAVLCDKIALIQLGKILAIDIPANMKNYFKGNLFAVTNGHMSKLLKDIRANKEVVSCYAFGSSLHVTLNDKQSNKLLEYLNTMQHEGIAINAIEPGIEDCFIQLMNSHNE
jgi:ABC-2 type transport system ATP-binding protein